MKPALLDTDTLSYVLSRSYTGVGATARQYLRVFKFFTISSITVTEVVKGYEKVEDFASLHAFERHLLDTEVLPLETAEAKLAGQMLATLDRAGQPIGILDPFIAATAIESDRVLITNNLRHYQRIVDAGFPLELDNWRA